MRQSQYFIPTLKETPSDAQMPSHKLMLRAGLVRQVSAGVFSWLPLGYKVLKQIMEVLREELNDIGGQEYLMPALNPIEIWEQTGRVEAMGDVMFHLKNRDGLVLAPTHEEIIAYHASHSIKSYKELPQIWYQIQNKFRNEPRPKSGVMRGRQFLMKDSYSLDYTEDGLDVSYNKHAKAYEKIFNRCGIKFFVVGASSGAMGGNKSQEFMVESEFGEDTCAVNYESGYAANIEVATSKLNPLERTSSNEELEKFETPGCKSINNLVHKFDFDEKICAKTLVYMVDSEPILILMRGNDELNESKLETVLETNKFRPAEEDEIIKLMGASPGSLGPVGVKKVRIISDNLLKNCNGLVTGANEDGMHFKNFDTTRDVKIDNYYDLRTITEGEPDPIDGKPLKVVKAIELGHIFKLGSKYSSALNANVLDENGKEVPIIMGSYGIGVERMLACIIEQNHDKWGIKWKKDITPFHIHILALAYDKSDEVKKIADNLYEELSSVGFDVLLDDRKERPGFKFKDADLIGIPLQITIGDRGLSENTVELKMRHEDKKIKIGTDEILQQVKEFYK